MDLIKSFGRFGIVIAFMGFIVLFVQNLMDSEILKSAINYNLSYKVEVQGNNNESIGAITLFNNGLSSISDIKVFVQSRNNTITSLDFIENIDSIGRINENKREVLKKIEEVIPITLYPTENFTILFRIEHGSSIETNDLLFAINNANTSGYRIFDTNKIPQINKHNLNLYLYGVKEILIGIFLKVLGPLFGILIVLFIIYRVIDKKVGLPKPKNKANE